MSQDKAKQSPTDIERAKYAGNIQTAISLLHCSLKDYILKTITENGCIITIDKTDDFADLLKFIVNNWTIVFSQNSDSELYKLANRCIQINKSVSRQALRFDRELEHLIKLGKLIKCSNIDYFASTLVESTDINGNVGEIVGEQSKSWLKHKNDGNDYFKKGQFTEAMVAYSKAIAIDSKQSVLYSNRALCELKLEKYELAREDAEDAIALEGNNVKYYRILTECLWNLSLYQETEASCDQGLKLDPYDETLLLRKRNSLARIATLINDKNPTKVEEITEEHIKKVLAYNRKIYDNIVPKETEIEHIDTMNKVKLSMSINKLVFLAHSYRDGIGTVKKDLNKAIEMYTKAAKEGSAEALYNLGTFYGSGRGEIVLDYARMLECFEKAAAQKPYLKLLNKQLIANTGVAESMNALGTSYRDGRGVDKDAKKAFEYYKQSAHYNYSAGQNNLACFLNKGIGVRKNETSARYWFERAADQEIAEAQFNYAQMLEEGVGGEKDENRALEYYKKAAEQGLPGALERIQILTTKGSLKRGQKKNVENLIEKLEIDEDAEALYLKGKNFFEGTNNCQVDYEKAYFYLKKAADQNHDQAVILLAQILLFHIGKNKEAFEYFLKASTMPLVCPALVYKNLMTMHINGHGCERDEAKAQRYYTRYVNSLSNSQTIESDQSSEEKEFISKEEFDEMIERGKELCDYEKNNGLSSESILMSERIKRYLMKDKDTADTEKKKLYDFIEEIMTQIGEKTSPIGLQRHFKEETKLEMIKRAQKGSITAANYIRSEILNAEGINLLNQGSYSQAFEKFVKSYKFWSIFSLSKNDLMSLKRALDKHESTKDKNSMLCKAFCYFGDDIRSCILHLEKCIRLYPREAYFYYILSCSYAFNNKYNRSIDAINRALELEYEPRWLYIKASAMRLAFESDKTEKIHETINVYKDYIKQNPSDDTKIVEAYYSIGNLYFAKDDDQNALENWRRAQIAENESIRLPALPPVDKSHKSFFMLYQMMKNIKK
jgi:uncharacterized protein